MSEPMIQAGWTDRKINHPSKKKHNDITEEPVLYVQWNSFRSAWVQCAAMEN